MARPTLSIPKTTTTEAPAPAAAPEVVEETTAASSEPVKPIEVPANPRNAAIAALAQSAAAETGSDGAVPLVESPNREAAPAADDEDIPADPVAPSIADVAAAHAAEAAPAPASDAEAEAAAAGKKFIVDVKGVKQEVDQEAVIEAGLHALRHKGAAEQALAQASALLAEARKYGPAPAPAAPAAAPASPAFDEHARALAKALQMGSEDEAAKAVAELRRGGANEEDVQAVVAREVGTHVRLALDQDRGAKALEALVPEMLTDKYVLQTVLAEERAARAAGDTRTYSELYPEIGKRVRGWIDGLKGAASGDNTPTPAAPAPAAATIQQRTAAKAATPAPVAPRSAAAPAPTNNRPPSGSQIVEQMRQARGRRSY